MSRETLQIYRKLLRGAYRFPQYNIREYALRKIRSSFRDEKGAIGLDASNLIAEATSALELIQRQSVIYSLYHSVPPTPSAKEGP